MESPILELKIMGDRSQKPMNGKGGESKSELGFHKLFFTETEDEYEDSKMMSVSEYTQVADQVGNKKVEERNLAGRSVLHQGEKKDQDMDEDSEFYLDSDSSLEDILDANFQMMRLYTLIQNCYQQFVTQECIFQPNILQDIGRLRFILIQNAQKTIQKSINKEDQFDLDIYLELMSEFKALQHFIYIEYPYLNEEIDEDEEIMRYEEMTNEQFDEEFQLLHTTQSIEQILECAQIEALLQDQFQYGGIARKLIHKALYNQQPQIGPLDDILQKGSLFDTMGKLNQGNKNQHNFSVSIRRDQKPQNKSSQPQGKKQIQLFNLPPITFDKPSEQDTSKLTYQQFVTLLDKQKQKKEQIEKIEEKKKEEKKKSHFDQILGRKTEESSKNYLKPFVGQISSKQSNEKIESFFGMTKENSMNSIEKNLQQRSTPSFKAVPQQHEMTDIGEVVTSKSTAQTVQHISESSNTSKENLSERKEPSVFSVRQNLQIPNANLRDLNTSRNLRDLNTSRIPAVLNFQPGIQSGMQPDKMQDISTLPATLAYVPPPSTNMTGTINQTQRNPFISGNKASSLISSHVVPAPNHQTDILNTITSPSTIPTNIKANPLASKNTSTINFGNTPIDSNTPNFSNVISQPSQYNQPQRNLNPFQRNLTNARSTNSAGKTNISQSNPEISIQPLPQRNMPFPPPSSSQPQNTSYQSPQNNLNQASNFVSNSMMNPIPSYINPQQIKNPPQINFSLQQNVPFKSHQINPLQNKSQGMTPQKQHQPNLSEPIEKKIQIPKSTRIKKRYDQATLQNMKLKDFISSFCQKQLKIVYRDLFSQLLVARKWKLLNFKLDSAFRQKLSDFSRMKLSSTRHSRRQKLLSSRLMRNIQTQRSKYDGITQENLKMDRFSQDDNLTQPYLLMRYLKNKLEKLNLKSLLVTESNFQPQTNLRNLRGISIEKVRDEFNRVEEVQDILEKNLSTLEQNLQLRQKKDSNQPENMVGLSVNEQICSTNKAIQSLQEWILSNNLCTIPPHSIHNQSQKDAETLLQRQNTVTNQAQDFQMLNILYNSLNSIDTSIQMMDHTLYRLKESDSLIN